MVIHSSGLPLEPSSDHLCALFLPTDFLLHSTGLIDQALVYVINFLPLHAANPLNFLAYKLKIALFLG